MESKIPEWLFSFYESQFLAQLRTFRQLKSPKPKRTKRKEDKGMSNMYIEVDILRRSQGPLHVSAIIAQVKTQYGVPLDRESLVSALVKKAYRRQGLLRTAPNTFQIETEGK